MACISQIRYSLGEGAFSLEPKQGGWRQGKYKGRLLLIFAMNTFYGILPMPASNHASTGYGRLRRIEILSSRVGGIKQGLQYFPLVTPGPEAGGPVAGH